jgi:predicted NUDIX family NTP pyrophosphohydrolase
MPRQSAGLLVYRRREKNLEVFLVHPGGPFWKNKDAGVWSIPKGEFVDGEDPLAVAKREFQEETSMTVDGEFIPLQPIKQRGGKIVHAWAVEGDFDASRVNSNTCTIEWPRKSGKSIEIPEVDRGDWFDMVTAMKKIKDAQRDLLEELQSRVK